MTECYISRCLDVEEILKRKSIFLLGPRQTGKSSYIRNQLNDIRLNWSLLDNELYRALMDKPSLLRSVIKANGIKDGVVAIDEIQRMPELLNEIHMLIEETNIHFLLTGSSARKLRRQGTNLLGGRAGQINFHPFVYPEISDKEYELVDILNTGLLPNAFMNPDADGFLSDYVDLYMKEEIEIEGAVRHLPPFWSFLQSVARQSGEIINYSNISRDIGISSVSVQEWYRILVDTLLGYEIPPYRKSVKRKPNSTSKFYLFDIGVARKLQGLNEIDENSSDFGRYFENYIAMEIRSYLDYNGKREALSYWHTKQTGYEVDFIIGDRVAIEAKSTKKVSSNDLRGLKAFQEENIAEKYILVSRENYPQLLDNGILILPYKDFLDRLWNGQII